MDIWTLQKFVISQRDKDMTYERIETYIQDIFIRNIILEHLEGY